MNRNSQPDFSIHGTAYKYTAQNGRVLWLDPMRMTVYTKDPEEGVVIGNVVPGRPVTRTKRMIQDIASPGRVAMGLPVAFIISWLASGEHFSLGLFIVSYVAWIIFGLAFFGIKEAYAWAGGKPKLRA